MCTIVFNSTNLKVANSGKSDNLNDQGKSKSSRGILIDSTNFKVSSILPQK